MPVAREPGGAVGCGGRGSVELDGKGASRLAGWRSGGAGSELGGGSVMVVAGR